MGADHFQIIREIDWWETTIQSIRKLFVTLSFIGCFIARYTEVAAFEITLLLHGALLIIIGGNGTILIEMRRYARQVVRQEVAVRGETNESRIE